MKKNLFFSIAVIFAIHYLRKTNPVPVLLTFPMMAQFWLGQIDALVALGLAMVMGYLGDLTDEDLMKRPIEGTNHIKWQLGHLIAAEHQMIEGVAPGSMPPLPEGFAEKHKKDTQNCGRKT